MGYSYTKTLFIVYLEFKFNWVSYIIFAKSCNPHYRFSVILTLTPLMESLSDKISTHDQRKQIWPERAPSWYFLFENNFSEEYGWENQYNW